MRCALLSLDFLEITKFFCRSIIYNIQAVGEIRNEKKPQENQDRVDV
jgi:hypothetical protein